MSKRRIINRLYIFLFLFYTAPVSAQQKNDTTTNNVKSSATKVFNGLFKYKDHTFNYNAFNHLYPVRDNPTMGYRSSYIKNERIMVDVHPVLYLVFLKISKRN